jgi:hypothetical protein
VGEEGGRRWFGLVLSWSWEAGVLGYLEKNKVTSVMALGKNKKSFRHGPGESESLGLLGGEHGKGVRREPYLIGKWLGRGCCTLEGQGMGYGTQPHDWKTW